MERIKSRKSRNDRPTKSNSPFQEEVEQGCNSGGSSIGNSNSAQAIHGETIRWWSKVLMEEGACTTSLEEASIMAEVLLEELISHQRDPTVHSAGRNGNDDHQEVVLARLEQNLQEHMGLGGDANDLAKKLLSNLDGPKKHDQVESDQDDNEEHVQRTRRDSEEGDDNSSDDNHTDEDGVTLLIDGECELCDRFIQLTKHHLIPKSTWPRLEVKLLHAAQALHGAGDVDKATRILGPGLVHLLVQTAPDLQENRQMIRKILHRTCDICRPCHTTVHRTHDNMTLALSYNTIHLLLQDKQISNFCKWANKQRVGKYSK